MANTLKFGNGQWATKEGSTLAYNDENGNFKPLPFNFERSTSATRVNKQGLIEVVSNNEPRIDYKDDSKGALLLEPSRTNYILKSDDVLSTYQSQNGDVSNASESINGFNNSIQIEYDASNSLIYKRDFTPTIGTEYTISCFVQMNDNSAPIHTVDVNSGDFCLINNNTLVSASDIKTERLGSTNVYRVSATKIAVDTNNRFGIIKYATQSNKGFKVTAFQLEQQSYATSYIPTQGAISTRVAETCSQTPPSGIIGQTEGVLYFESKINAQGTYTGITLSDNSTNNEIIVRFTTTDRIEYYLRSGGSQPFGGGTTLFDTDEYVKVAFAYKSGDSAFYVNGTQVITSTTTTMPLNLISLKMSRGNGTGVFDGKVKNLRVYNTRLSNSELAALTQV